MVKYKQLYHNKKNKIINEKKKFFYIFGKIEEKKDLDKEYIKIDYNGNKYLTKKLFFYF